MWRESKSRVLRRVLGRCSTPVCLVFAALLAAFLTASLNEVDDSIEGESDECLTLEGSSDELDFRFQTLLTWPEKRPKFFEPEWRPSKRRGKRRVVTTLFNIHSLEAVPVFFKRLPPQRVLDNFFRCRGFGEEHVIDPVLINALIETADKFKSNRVNIISAYRSPKFNDALAKKGRRVAQESKHTRGQAIDFSLPEVPASRVGAWLVENFEGGVGIYRNDNFVHIDIGQKRRWFGK